MRRRMFVPLIVALLIGFIAGGIVGVRAATCTTAACTYLPLVRYVHAASDACVPPTEPPSSVVAWLTNYTITPGEPLSVCVYVGQSSPGYTAYTVVHQRSGDFSSLEFPAATNGPIMRLQITTAGLAVDDLVAIDVLYGAPGAHQRIAQLYVLIRAAL